MPGDNALRSIFNQAASDYAAARPGYPEQLFEDVISLSGIPQGGQALEIGCGTGQATLPFARRGYHILCLDIGLDLLKIAAEKLRPFPNVRFENIAFEDWPVRLGEFDLVYAATALHWVPKEIAYPKAVTALKPGATLAVFSNAHPRPYTGFFVDVQPIYRQYLPEQSDPRQRPTTEAEIAKESESLRVMGLFSSVEVRTYPWTKTYATAEYIRLLNTYSDHLAMDETRRHRLYQDIADLIESRYAGKVERPYLTVLYSGKKASN